MDEQMQKFQKMTCDFTLKKCWYTHEETNSSEAYEIIEMSEKTKEVIEKGKASEEVIEMGVDS